MFTLQTFQYLSIGALLGLTAGISPGPLLSLMLMETLRHNLKAGIKIAFAPLITDLPVILISLAIFSRLSAFHTVLGLISLAGGIFIAYMGYETFRTKSLTPDPETNPSSLRIGIITNFLSPHPYLFWATIGAPLALKAAETNTLSVILFFLSFYLLLVGSKVGVALIAARSKTFLNNQSYLRLMQVLGISLFLFSLYFLYDGMKMILE
ncbi:MAG: LysE family transporter [Bacteroidia bacterium]